MQGEESLFGKLNRLYPKLSKGQKRLADFVMKHYDKAAFMTAAELGREAEVSESTTVRFASLLGYSGFPEFHETLEELVRNRLNSIQRMEVAYGQIPQSGILHSVLSSDIEKIKLTMEHMDPEEFQKAVDIILNARTVYVLGIRSCAPLAEFLSFYLHEILKDVRLVSTNSPTETFEQMIRIEREDVLIGISFPRYSMRTLKAVEFAHNRGAKVITLTDSMHAPINQSSSCKLIARSDMASIVDSLTAPLSVINALVVALTMRKKDEVIRTMKLMEEIWNEYQVYSSEDEIAAAFDVKAMEEDSEEKEKGKR
ncbi:MAG: MurR/RpiR family transcriptional regulator [Eubacteriales bacterium]|nr:MurR/RpiR family transcriptional regulator [Eubacteriales bacterium]